MEKSPSFEVTKVTIMKGTKADTGVATEEEEAGVLATATVHRSFMISELDWSV